METCYAGRETVEERALSGSVTTAPFATLHSRDVGTDKERCDFSTQVKASRCKLTTSRSTSIHMCAGSTPGFPSPELSPESLDFAVCFDKTVESIS